MTHELRFLRSIQFLRCYLLASDHALVSEGQVGCPSESNASSLLTQNDPAYRQVARYNLEICRLQGYSIMRLSNALILLAFSLKDEGQYIIVTQFCQASPSSLSGDEGTRTPDLLRAREALSHLSYIPLSVVSDHHLLITEAVGLTRLELVTFPLSEGCSNQLSYRPIMW